MKRWYLYGLLLMVSCFTGCLYTLNPLFKPEDLQFNQRLLGTFTNEDGTFTFSRATAKELEDFSATLRQLDDKLYILEYQDKDKPEKLRYLAGLLTLHKQQFLDLYFLKPDRSESSNLYVSSHKFCKINITNKQIELRQLNDEFLEKEIKSKKVNIPYLQRNDKTMIITADTEALQQYIIKYMQVAEAFETNATVCKRK